VAESTLESMQGAYQDTFDNNIQPDMPVNRKMSEPETTTPRKNHAYHLNKHVNLEQQQKQFSEHFHSDTYKAST
jgi:hypothetical protein